MIPHPVAGLAAGFFIITAIQPPLAPLEPGGEEKRPVLPPSKLG